MSTFLIDPGTKLTIKGERFEVTETAVVSGNPLPIEEKKQKTYMLKAVCPVCHRVVRVTQKNWDPTDARDSLTCMHKDGNAYNLVLDNPESLE